MIVFHCALACEARPLIDFYKLKQVCARPFSLYSNQDIFLVVSGIGAQLSCAALGFAQGYIRQENLVWINFGVCGSRSIVPGEAFIVNKASDPKGEQVFYPPVLFDIGLKGHAIISSAQAETNYNDDALFDMEAVSFFHIATMFSTSELVQSIKVVSDNEDTGLAHVDKEYVTKLLVPQVEKVDALKNILMDLSLQLSEDDSIDQSLQWLMDQWHFSVSQQRTATHLLLRIQVLNAQLDWRKQLDGVTSSRQALACLTEIADSLEFVI